MAEARACPECGTELAADAPEGLCPACLLHSGLASAWLLSPRKTAQHAPGPFVAPEPGELARHFPQLELLGLLGQGGMGAVYQARQTKLDRSVALKVLPPNLQDPAFAERFTREARALARLNHPNIVGVHDFGESGGLYYFIMEFVDGASLREVLLEGRLSPAESLKILPQLCDALQYAHDEGVVHRDIKPENILLDKRGRVKVADFGLAKLVGAAPANYALTGSRQIMGTPHYMAPEQMEKPQTVDHRADIYSLGVVLYEMLTGELPLGRFAPPSHKAAVEGRLDEIVHRALAKEPGERYQNVSDLKAEVEHAPAGSAAAAPVRAANRHLGARFVASDNWCSQVLGQVRLDGDAVVFEYMKDFLGFYKTGVKERRVPLAELVQFELEKRWCGTKLVIGSSRLSALDGLPGVNLGQARLNLTGTDRKAAEELVEAVQARLMLRAAPAAAPADPDRLRLRTAIQAAGLLVSALAAVAFWLILGLVYIADEGPRFRDFHGVAGFGLFVLVAAATVLGLSAVMAAGAWNLRRCRRYGLVVLAAVIAAIPWSPHALLGLPTAIWVLIELSRFETKQAFLWGGWRPRRPQAPPTGYLRRRARSVLRGFRTLFFDSYASPEGVVPDDPRHTPTALHANPPPVASFWEPPALSAVADDSPWRREPRHGLRKLLKLALVLGFVFVVIAMPFTYLVRRQSHAYVLPVSAPLPPRPIESADPDRVIRDFLRPLNLAPQGLKDATAALQEARREYLRLEEQHAKLSVEKDTGRLLVTMTPFANQWRAAESRFVWKRLDGILSKPQQRVARQNQDILTTQLFPFVNTSAQVRIWKMGDWYYWNDSRPDYNNPVNFPPEAELPKYLERYWKKGEKLLDERDD